MAYARKRNGGRTRKAAYSRKRSGSGGYNRRAATRRTARRSSGRASSGRGGTVRIVVEQAPAQTISPIQQALIDQGKVVLPRKAQF